MNDNKYIKKSTFVVVIILILVLSVVLSLGTFVLITSHGGLNGRSSATVEQKNQGLAKETGSQKTIEEIVKENQDAVVEIKTESVSTDNWLSSYVKEGAGSGVIIKKDGYILTCNHVIEGASRIQVTLRNKETYIAKVVGADPKTDVAVIKINGKDFTSAKIGNSSKLSVGSLAVAIGNPLGQLGGSASAGIISSLDREIQLGNNKMSLLQTDASINPGNSGGGLFDGKGNLIGIVVAKSGGKNIEGIGFAIPIDRAYPIAKSLMKDGKVKGRAALGIKIVDVNDPETASQFGVKITGVYIAEVVGKNAKKAGFKKGDLIYKFDGQKIDNSSDLFVALEKEKPGKKVDVTVIRDNKEVKITTVLEEA